MIRKSTKIKPDINFFIVALAVAAGIFVVLLDSGKYFSNIDLLLIPKNEKTAFQIDKIRNNLVHIFEKKNERPEAELKIRDGDSILSIETESYIGSEAVSQAEKTSQEIINIASIYYNVKNDLDIRIIRGGTRKAESGIFIIALASVLIGGLISFCIQIVLNYLENSAYIFLKRKKEAPDTSRGIENMLIKNRSKIENLSGAFSKGYADEKFPTEKSGVEPVYFKKAAFPQNLPMEISEQSKQSQRIEETESVPGNLPFEVMEEPEGSGRYFDEKLPEESSEEPTEEEYKRRLNQLLKGE
ncbi:MAG: hypothetical protein PHH24_00525 [Candidatus Moranbacteria bacterium]|jgi:hypothetical protein|nr:hypothetical protein [Candidatus Moranbacteria bacterium]MDX9855745.1 hypothetical protein [Candidatus Moranbacteria bacterium]